MRTAAMRAAPAAPAPQGSRSRRAFWLGVALAVAVLGGVFALYRQPEFLRLLGDMIWSCFG